MFPLRRSLTSIPSYSSTPALPRTSRPRDPRGPPPHRGVQPVSLLFRARIGHRDSLGNHATVTSGGMR
ncbi:MAG: pirin family protein [Acidimicrobiia bacterium]|nr:pirin family protein [Acidimicrobiia bacterium]